MMEDVKYMLMLAKVYKRSIQSDKELETLSNVKDVQLRSAYLYNYNVYEINSCLLNLLFILIYMYILFYNS